MVTSAVSWATSLHQLNKLFCHSARIRQHNLARSFYCASSHYAAFLPLSHKIKWELPGHANKTLRVLKLIPIFMGNCVTHGILRTTYDKPQIIEI